MLFVIRPKINNVEYIADSTFSFFLGDTTGQRVKVIVTDFMKDNVFSEIEDQLRDLNIGVLGWIFFFIFLPKQMNSVNPYICLKSDFIFLFPQMCKIILPGMENREKGVIVNISSGVASIPFPLYTLYAASKVFVERFSQGLQAEYKDKGIIIQTVAPFGVSTRLAGYQSTNIVTLSPEDFVKSSLQYLRAGDKTHGSVCHIVLGWLLQSIPLKVLYSEIYIHIYPSPDREVTSDRI
uniref:Hydroxysteroid (17-beta) dehydrogenase 3 n=1 Tax=Sander lucioperca TaxID=283035 RepID=A0A8C9X0Y5_SANLU